MTIGGNDDNAVITGVDAGTVTEDLTTQVQGQLSVTDSDLGEDHFQASQVTSNFGTLSITKDGAWTYNLDNNNPVVQGLGQGSTATDIVTVHSADGTAHQVMVTINGTNDSAVIGGTNSSAVTEESQMQTSGTLAVTDVDTGEAHFSNTDIVGNLGTLHLTDSGAWTYDLDNTNPTVQALGKGATATDTITVHSADGTSYQVTITVNGTNDAAVIMGTSTGDVHEGHTFTARDGSMTGGYVDDRSPDHQHGNIGKLWNDEIHTDGHLSIVDADAGESYAQTGTYYGTHGRVILQTNGDWTYYASIGQDATGRAIDHLGKGESLTDTVTVKSTDGTTHDIVVTIHGDNDSPYCSSEVQLNSGKEDLAQTITASELLANTIDVDTNDIGKLTIANLHADHGSIQDNQDGTYTFTPTKDYNGKVSFTYDVQDAHGGSVATSASITLAPTRDSAVITGTDTGTIIEDHNVGHSSNHPVAASGLLNVSDPDAGQDHFQVNRFGEQVIHDPFGGFLRITPNGAWGYEVANSRLQSLAEGEVEKVVYRVYSADHTAHDITITVTGTNDQPTITATTLAHGTEDTHYQMQAGQFGFSDIDTGDTLHSIAITDLPPTAQGKFLLDGHDVTAGQHIPTADIIKLQFVPAQDFNGDVQFKYTVNDGHTDSTQATNTLHIDAVGDKAVISGVDTGDVYENRNPDMSPDFAQPGLAHLTNSMIHVEGQLTIIDPDTGENSFDSKGIGYTYHGKYGHLILNTDGKWFYGVATGTADVNGGLTTNVGSMIDQLGANETLTDTITIQSKDGTTHDIVITIHGDNDRPYCNSEVQLISGKEDTQVSLTAQELLANTVDVDANDVGKLTIANLHADHGSIQDNKDGTFTFTPEKDYNGVVHFSYDVKDAHGGVTHTGASTTLAAVDDKTIISGVDHGVATEDVATHMLTHVNIMDAVDWQALQITDVDSPNTQVTVEFAGKQYTWNVDSGLDVTTPYGKFLFRTIASGSHKGEHSWSYIGDNNNVHVQELKQGESLTESIKLIATDGTEFPITVKVNGTEDGVVIDSKSELGHVVENAQTGASVSGNVVAHDVDLHDTVSWTQTPTAGISGQYGTFHLSADGQWHYDVDQSKATTLGDGTEYWEHFTVEAVSTDGSHVSKSVSVVVHGNNDVPTVSGEVTLPSGKEDTSTHITQAELIANATDVDINDRGWLHVQNLTADHGNLVSNSDGSFTFNPDPNYNGVVHFTYDVADRHGGIAHTGANTTLAAVNDAAVITGTGGHLLEEDNLYYGYTIKTSGQFQVVDPDGPSQLKFPDGLHHHTGSLGGTLQLYGNGNYFYHIDNSAVNHLAKGQEAKETFTIHSVDGTSHQVEFVIEGTNDAPFVHGDVTLSPGTEDTAVTLHVSDLLAQAGDYDDGETARLSVHNLSADHGTIIDNKDGTYTFNPDADYNGAVHFTYDVQDPQGATVATSASMALAAVADAAVIGGADSGNIKEDVHVDSKYDISLSGHLTIQDPDGPTEALFQTISLATTPQGGTLQLYSNGNWFYDINNYAIDHLDEGQIVQDTMTVYSKDGTAHVLHFTIEGTNDIPDINAQTRYLAEDGKVLNGKMYAYDPDDHAQLTFTLGHPVDGLTMHKDGSYSFDPSNSAYQHISQNVQRTIQVPVTVTDEHGAHTTQNLSFVITGSNDGAVITGNDRGDVSEDLNVQHHELQTQGALTSHDIDNVDNAFKDESLSTLKDGSHALGTLHMDTSGTWTYTVDNRTIQSMNSNDTKVETFVVHSVDGTNHEVAVTIHGTNDAPTTPLVHTSHPAPPPPPPVPHDEPDMTSHVDFTVVQSDDSYLDLTQQPHQEPDQKTSHHGAAAYLDVLGIKPDLTSTTVHDQPADMDIVFAQVDQQDAATHDQVHLDMSDALEHHDVNINHNQDDGHHHHNDVDGLPDIDPNS